MMMGRIFAVTCAQFEASVAEHAAADCDGLKESLGGRSCANEHDVPKQISKAEDRTLR